MAQLRNHLPSSLSARMKTTHMLQKSEQTNKNRTKQKLYTMQTWKKKILEKVFFLHCFEFGQTCL